MYESDNIPKNFEFEDDEDKLSSLDAADIAKSASSS